MGPGTRGSTRYSSVSSPPGSTTSPTGMPVKFSRKAAWKFSWSFREPSTPEMLRGASPLLMTVHAMVMISPVGISAGG